MTPTNYKTHYFVNLLLLILIALLITPTAHADINVKQFNKLYYAGQFDAAVAAFDKAIQSEDKNLNKETLIDMFESAFSQSKNPSSELLKQKLLVAAKAKMLFFVKKRVRATLKAVPLFDQYKNANTTELHSALVELSKFNNKTLTYPHNDYAKLRVMDMILNQRRIQGKNEAGDHYLQAIIHDKISKSGDSQLKEYFKKADKTDQFYQQATKLKALYKDKYNIDIDK